MQVLKSGRLYAGKQSVSKSSEGSLKRPLKIVLRTLIVLLLLAGTAYAWRSYSYSSQVKQLHEQMTAAFQNGGGPGGRGGNREQWQQMRAQIDSLPEAYKQQFREQMRENFAKRMEQHLDEFLAMSKEERRKELDKRIVQDEERRKQWEAARAAQGNQAGNAGNGNNGPGNGQGRGNGGGGGRGGWGGGRGSPDMRAKMTEYRRQMNERRQEQGLPPLTRGGGRGFPGGFPGGGGPRGGGPGPRT